jgi:cyclophilin family peptidyl-prolyl cis-trans isomerase
MRPRPVSAISRRLALGALTLASVAGAACSAEPRAPNAAVVADTPPARPAVPSPAATPMRSPDRYRVRLETTKGDIVIEVKRTNAPRGADRFYELVTIGYFTDVAFYRMMPDFIAQFGISGDSAVNAAWNSATIPDDPMVLPNARETVSFAASGPNSRSTQLFISMGDNRRKLDRQKLFAPIGRVVEGMDVADKLSTTYGEEPNHYKIVRQGDAYLKRWFPGLDYIRSATLAPIAAPSAR